MNAGSVDSRSWRVSLGHRPVALEIALLKRSYVLPWSQFLYAEGGDDEVHAFFATHVVIVRGAGLTALLADLAAENVTVVREPARVDRFQAGADRSIREVIVQKLEAAAG